MSLGAPADGGGGMGGGMGGMGGMGGAVAVPSQQMAEQRREEDQVGGTLPTLSHLPRRREQRTVVLSSTLWCCQAHCCQAHCGGGRALGQHRSGARTSPTAQP